MDRKTGFLNEALEGRSWDEQRSELERRLRDLVVHAAANAPAVAAKLRAAGVDPRDAGAPVGLSLAPVGKLYPPRSVFTTGGATSLWVLIISPRPPPLTPRVSPKLRTPR